MPSSPPPPARLARIVRDPAASLSHHEAARRVRAGDLERVRPGVVRPKPVPLELVDRFDRHEEQRARYLDEVGAVAMTRRRPAVFAGRSALAIWGYPVIGDWPSSVELLESPGTARRSKRGVVVHRARVEAEDVVPWGEHYVTTPARTLADLARSGDFAGGVVALDHALSGRARGAQSLVKDDLLAVLDRLGARRGLARASRVVAFADGRSGSGGESLSRVGMFLMGFEMPELQVRHPHPEGFYEVDFEWPAAATRPPVIGEFDGVMKYVRDEYRGGADASRVVVAEKLREDFLRAQGNGFIRWGWHEARAPVPALRTRLLRAGIRIVRRPMI
jgi:hypothetical protein